MAIPGCVVSYAALRPLLQHLKSSGLAPVSSETCGKHQKAEVRGVSCTSVAFGLADDFVDDCGFSILV